MCLATKGILRKTSGTGWKVFLLRDGGLKSDLHHIWVEECYQEGVWHHEEKFRPFRASKLFLEDTEKRYPMGFHIFRYKKDATQWKKDSRNISKKWLVIRKVKYQEAHTEGKQYSLSASIADDKPTLDVVVAKRMMILPAGGK